LIDADFGVLAARKQVSADPGVAACYVWAYHFVSTLAQRKQPFCG
jgi:hypothetical protein